MKTTPTLLAMSIALLVAQPSFAAEELKKTSVGNDSAKKIATKTEKISAADINKEMIGDIYDTANFIAGVEVANTGNRFGANGFNIRGMEGDAIAITVDGISMGESLNPVTFSRYGMFSSNRNGIEPESMKSVTVVKGASAVLSGSGALGGAVMYVTKDAKDLLSSDDNDAFGGSLKLGYDGRDNEKLVSVSLAKRIDDFEALAILTSREGNELNAHSDGVDVTGNKRGQSDPLDKSQTNVLFKLNYQASEALNLGFIFEDYKNNKQGKALSRQSATYSDFAFDDDSERQRIGIIATWQTNNSFFDELEIKANKQETFTSGVTAFDYTSRGATYLRTEDRNFKQEMTNLSVDFSRIIANGDITHNLIYGVEYIATDVNNSLQDIRYNGVTKDSGLRNGYPIIDPSWVPKTESKTTTIYLSDAIDLTEQLTVSAGARWDKKTYDPKVDDTFKDASGNAISKADFSTLNTQFAASYDINEHHNISGNIGTGHKAPTTQDLYLNTNGAGKFNAVSRQVDSAGSVTYVPTGRTETDLKSVTNPNLEGEKSINLEVSYRYSTDNFNIQFAVFQSKYDNMIVNEVRSNKFDSPMTTASLNWWLPQCRAQVLTDACYTVSNLSADTYTTPVNTGKVTVSGFEIEGAWQITNQLDLRFAYAHADGEHDTAKPAESGAKPIAKGDKLESVSPNNATLGLDFTSEEGNWGIGTMARYIAKKDRKNNFNATFYSDSATIVDLRAFYNITENLTIRGGIYNAFDKNYSLWNSLRNVRAGNGGFFGGVDYNKDTRASQGIARYSQPGREVAVNLNYTF